MRRGVRLLVWLALSACSSGAPVEECDTCSGASDCYALCVCHGGAADACQKRCPDSPIPEPLGEWPPAWKDFEAEIVTRTNQVRAEGGCCDTKLCFEPSGALVPADELTRAARLHARDMSMRQYFSHDSPDGETPFDRMRQQGFDGCAMGENLAQGQTSAADVVASWLASPEHCENLLDRDFRRVGVGYADSAGMLGPFWVQTLGD